MDGLISAIVPIYKSEKYIARCIESVLNQTYKNFELILVDDGSPDASGTICDKYAKEDARIKVIHKENGGVSSARNIGIDVSTGEYITFIDSDDYVTSGFFQYALEKIVESDADLFVSGVLREYPDGSKKEIATSAEKIYTTKALLEAWNIEYPPTYLLGPCCKLYNAKAIKDYKIRFDLSMNYAEDIYFNLFVLKNMEKILLSEKIFYCYTSDNPNSLTSKTTDGIIKTNGKVFGLQIELMKELNCSKKSINVFMGGYYYINWLAGLHGCFCNANDYTKTEKMATVKKVASDPYVRKIKMKYIKKKSHKIIYVFLKIRAYRLLYKLFENFYKNERV